MAQTKSMGYDSPVYQAVQRVSLSGTSTLAGGAQTGLWTAGASSISYKFVAFTNLIVKSATTAASTVGTGTSTSFVLGNVGTGNAPSLVRITDNGTTMLKTATGTYQMLGAYVMPAGATAITTAGAVINWVPQTAYTTAIGTSAASVEAATAVNNWTLINGGIPMKPGDTLNIVKGVDATEVIFNPEVEFVVQPLANVTP